jgi:hypothetical protein
MLDATTDLGSHPLHLVVVIRLSEEVLAGVNELIADGIRFDSLLKQILGASRWVVQNRLDSTDLSSLAS